MPSPSAVASPSALAAAIKPALEHDLGPVLADVWRTIDDPDNAGPRWLELSRGAPVDELFVTSDFIGNALHVTRGGRERLTIVFVPAWLYEVATLVLSQRTDLTFSLAWPEDLDRAVPLRVELTVEHEVTYEAAGPGFEDAGYVRLQHGYDYAPSRAVCSYDDPEAAAQGSPVTVPLAASDLWFPQPRWTPPTLRVVAAPGVSVDAQPLCDADVLGSARALYRMATEADESTLAQHAVRFELERRQDPLALPALGAPARPTPQTEGELAMGATALADGRPLVIERTRADGADLTFIRAYDEDLSSVSWLQQLSVMTWYQALSTFPAAAAAFLAALPDEALKSFAEGAVRLTGGLLTDQPLVVCVRMDPTSAEDRFAYRVDYLSEGGDALTGRTNAGEGEGPPFRLTIVRTKGVRVFIDDIFSSWGDDSITELIEFRERVAPFEDVPLAIEPDGELSAAKGIPTRDATARDILAAADEIAQWVPNPTLQMAYDVLDVGSLATFLIWRTDVRGLAGSVVFGDEPEPMTWMDFWITLGGLVLPEMAERGAKRLWKRVARVRMAGADPFARLVAADSAVVAEDALAVVEIETRMETAP